jgi:hypothetical protein
VRDKEERHRIADLDLLDRMIPIHKIETEMTVIHPLLQVNMQLVRFNLQLLRITHRIWMKYLNVSFASAQFRMRLCVRIVQNYAVVHALKYHSLS